MSVVPTRNVAWARRRCARISGHRCWSSCSRYSRRHREERSLVEWVVQFAGLGFSRCCVARGRVPTMPRTLAVVLAALFVLPLLQLIPLPPSVWTRLPGRAPFAATYEQLGLALPYLPISLKPQATWISVLGATSWRCGVPGDTRASTRAPAQPQRHLHRLGRGQRAARIRQLVQGPDSPLRSIIRRPTSSTASAFLPIATTMRGCFTA